MQQLSVFHVPGHPPGPNIETQTPGIVAPRTALLFETCQRRIWIDPTGQQTHSTHTGEEAFAFLLEVICGLQSRVFGETEVLGQFKAFCREHPELDPVGSWLLEDAKAIRSRFLTGIGSQSYGSVVRRWAGEQAPALILGTGQFAQKISPWLPGSTMVRSRDLSLCDERISALPEGSAVVIAAPMADSALSALSGAGARGLKWIDLRGKRGDFRASHTLEDLFVELERDQVQNRSLLPQTLAEISRRARARADRVVCRPMGWDDIA